MKTYVEIDFNNCDHQQLLANFYRSIYLKGFPDEDERESLENILKQEEFISKSERALYHCVVACIDGQPVGGIIGDYFAKGNFGVVEFLVVSDRYRKQCIGTELFSFLMQRFHKDAAQYGYMQGLDYCFFETENPWKVRIADKKRGISRLRILSRMTTGILDMEYIQPPLGEEKQSVEYLYLGVCVLNEQLSQKRVKTACVKSFLQEYFYYAFHMADFEDNPAYIRMKEKLTKDYISIVKAEELIEGMDRFCELKFRFSDATDEGKIRDLIESRFGNRKSFGAYEDIQDRYYIAEEADGTLVAITGLIDSGVYRGLEVDWTCISERYEHRGLITFMLGNILQDVNQDVYCSCWRWRGREINLKNAMNKLGFRKILENRTQYDSRYTNCKVICKAFCPIEGNCVCFEDLYVRRYAEQTK